MSDTRVAGKGQYGIAARLLSNASPYSYISPIQYQNYDCEQLAQEAQRIHARSAQLAGRLDEAASNDQAIMGVGLVLF